MKYIYFPGCKIPAWHPEYNVATRAVLQALSVELADMELNCCGYPARHRSVNASVFAAARILAMAETRDLDIVTPCKCCFGNLQHARFWLGQRPELHDYVNGMLAGEGLRYTGRSRPLHLLSVLTHHLGLDTICASIINPLKGLRVAVHYGCHALRPAQVVRFDNPLAPSLFENLVAVCGAEPVSWQLRLDCCGAPLWEKNNSLSLKLMRRKIRDARESGAMVLATACTWCQHHFDHVQSRHPDVSDAQGPLPAYTFSALLGLALGIPENQLGMDAAANGVLERLAD